MKPSERDRQLHGLTRAMGDGAFCLAVGSGASYDRGVPLWRELIGRLGTEIGMTEFEASLQNRDLPHVYDLLATWSSTAPANRPSVQRANTAGPLRNVLYSASKGAGEQVSSDGPPTQEAASRCLAILACFTALSCQSRAFHVLCYNVDTCLEEEIAHLGHDAVALVETRSRGPRQVRWQAARDRPEVWSRRRRQWEEKVEVRIYHPHGIVLRDGAARTLEMRESDHEQWNPLLAAWDPDPKGRRSSASKATGPAAAAQDDRDPVELGVVFGRKDYNQLFGSLNDPRNARQLAALLHFSCLFYGFSFNDPNVDRLLDVASTLRRLADPQPERLVPRHLNLAQPKAFDHIRRPTRDGWSAEVELAIRESQRLAGFGVDTRWHADHEQHKRFVVDLIRRVAGDRGYRWPGAYAPPEERLTP